jgi:mannose-6-phosphate isomerase-like protein (cupin superfamily)
MTENFPKGKIRAAQIVVPCADLTSSLEFYVEKLGFRLEMIFPADAPHAAVISGYGLTLRLEESRDAQPLTINLVGDFAAAEHEIVSPDGARVCLIDENPKIEIPEGRQEFVVSTIDSEDAFTVGRARMRYRDLIPNRAGGRFIASHIRIEEGGAVADYAHYHRIRFQMIYCVSGWARLVYEDQGEPFLMRAGDCVLQPPEIRHRVLECSEGFEVVEIGCPAVHETFAEHAFALPNAEINRERIFGNQRFAHHVADGADWKDSQFEGFEERDTRISEATNGLADVKVFRAIADTGFAVKHSGEFLFFFVLNGNLTLSGEEEKSYELKKYDCFVLPAGEGYFIEAKQGAEILGVRLPAK